MRNSRPKTLIIGAGPGGLASAMLAAASGFDVTVLERQRQVGGRTATFESPSGSRFDLGPTFFLHPQVLREVFAACGRRLDDEIELLRVDPHYRLIFGEGGQMDVTADVPRMQAEIARISEVDSSKLPDYIRDNRKKLHAFAPILKNPFNSLSDVFKLPLLQLLPLLRPGSSVDADLSRFFKDPRVRMAFSFQSKYLGMSPFNCPSLFTILSFIEHEYGVWHPRGGCGALSTAMAKVARELGVDIRLGEPVEGIDFIGRRAVGVRTPEGRHDCDSLVINADFADAMTRLVPDRLRRRWTDRKLARKRFSCSTFMMYMELEGRFPELAHHTIWLAEDYKRNLDEIEKRHTLSENPSFYVQNAVATDPGLAPADRTPLYLLVPVTHQHENVDWGREQQRFRSLALAQLSKIGLHDVERKIRWEKIMTPAGWQSEMGVHRGAVFNLSHSLNQMLHMRPRNRFEDLEGVYLVGGGTHPGSGLPVIFESAKISTRLMAEDFAMQPAVAPELPTTPLEEVINVG